MTDLSNAERLDLASRVFYYFRQQAEDAGSPAYRNLSDHDLMATLIGGLRQYADWRGVDFGSAIAAGNAAYSRYRAGEEFPYALGEEVEHRQRLRIRDFRNGDDDVPIACRGTVVSIYPERDGTQTYHVRFPGEADPRPLKSGDIQPAPGVIRIGTSQGNLESLAEAERVFVETGARIRSCQLRDAPPAEHDITDRDNISAALAEACALAPGDIPRLLAAEVTARAEEITRPWRPASASHPIGSRPSISRNRFRHQPRRQARAQTRDPLSGHSLREWYQAGATTARHAPPPARGTPWTSPTTSG